MKLGTSIEQHDARYASREHTELSLVRELWAYRELFYFLAWRDIKVRYKQTVLGVLWAVIQPLFTMAIFTVIFGKLADIPSDGVPRPIFYFAALVPWIYFSSSLSSAGMSLVSNSDLLRKIYFPRIILPAAAVLGSLVDFFIGSFLLIGFIAYYDLPLGLHLILWPLLVVPLALMSFGVGLFLAALNVKYRDIKYAIPFGIQLMLFVTPIIYPSSVIPEAYRWLGALNPLTGLIEAFRFAVVPSYSVNWTYLWLSLVTTALVFVLGVAYFRQTEREFADVI